MGVGGWVGCWWAQKCWLMLTFDLFVLPRAEEVQGKGFSPWSFPDIHAKLGKETERG